MRTPEQEAQNRAELLIVDQWRRARTTKTGWTPSADLYQDFLAYSRKRGVQQGFSLTRTRWGMELRRLGVQKFRNSKHQWGLVLKAED